MEPLLEPYYIGRGLLLEENTNAEQNRNVSVVTRVPPNDRHDGCSDDLSQLKRAISIKLFIYVTFVTSATLIIKVLLKFIWEHQ